MASNAASSGKRAPAKRSQARPAAAATKNKKNGNGNGNEKAAAPVAEETRELTVPDLIAKAIKDEHLGILDSDGRRLPAADGVTYIVEKITEAKGVAKKVKTQWIKLSDLNKQLASLAIDIRQSIILNDGKPDWFGSSGVYKAAWKEIVDAAWEDGHDENRTTVRDRLNKVAQRQLGERIALYAATDAGLDLEEDDVLRVYNLGVKVLEDEYKNDEAVKKLVPVVNKHYRVGSTDDSGNKGDSPFVEKQKVNRGTPGPSENKATAAAESIKGFRSALPNATFDLVGPEYLHLTVAIEEKTASGDPAFGDGGKEGWIGYALHARHVLDYMLLNLGEGGRKPNKEEKENYEKARKAIK